MDGVREAALWAPETEGAVRCALCAHRCRIREGRRGLCGVRSNRGGTLETLVYGRLVARNVDPVEKKPLFHVAPGSLTYSVATAGCNFICDHCQNHTISQAPRDADTLPGEYASPELVVDDAVAAGCRSIAYTYTEPTIFFEYALDCMNLARDRGLRNLFVTNGFMTPEARDRLVPILDAANIDLKAMSDGFYRGMCGGRLGPVLDSIADLHERGVWIEVTTLVIPGLNDSDDELEGLARFLVELDADVPWHVTGFHPTYRLTHAPPTPFDVLDRARRIGLESGLNHVYIGNRPGRGGENTLCPGCGHTVIARTGFTPVRTDLTPEAECANCNRPVPGLDLGGSP